MCGCWEGSGASAASAGFSRSLLFSYSPFTVYSISLYLSTYLYPSFILSSLRLALTVGLWYLQIQIPNFSGAITQPLSFSGPPFFVSLSLSLSLFLLFSFTRVLPRFFPFLLLESFVLLFRRALSGSFCNVCNGPPTPGKPRWVSNTYLHGRGTTVSVPSSVDPVHTPRSAASTTAMPPPRQPRGPH